MVKHKSAPLTASGKKQKVRIVYAIIASVTKIIQETFLGDIYLIGGYMTNPNVPGGYNQLIRCKEGIKPCVNIFDSSKSVDGS